MTRRALFDPAWKLPLVVALCGALLTMAAARGQAPSEAPAIAGTESVLSTMPPLEESTAGQQRYVSAVDVDGSGNIYAIQRLDRSPITALAPAGIRIASGGEGMFDLPHGIRVDAEGNVWAT